ncbi:TPA: plasmid replication initiation protein, partial [Klebsiella pneumoniae]|nr:plasmid replication initiation protein [Staphylococcus aureus]HBY5608185.1 plasmid replication initiation protein [Klebsiella pneumoniae]
MIRVTGGKRQQRRVSRVCDTGDMPLPRSLTR